MNFRKLNNITGWAVFFVAFLVYFLTREARGSLWDCGEFVAVAKNVGLPHPPGAPMFVLLGRFFIILFGDNGQTAANAVNFMSALASAATILFLFWSVTHFARKMFVTVGEQLTTEQSFTVMAAGVVGAFAYTFSDSFWYSAVEGEVYALSSFFTALVFWAILKWEHADEHAGSDAEGRSRADRWIIFLFFMMGLSVGVHLLNLLTIPAIVMVYYYRRYKPTVAGGIIAFIIGCVIVGLVQVVAIQYSMIAAGEFDVFFVNDLGMPFFVGFAFYFIALAALIVWAFRFTEKNITSTKMMIWFGLFFFLTALPFVIAPGEGLKLGIIVVVLAAVILGYFLKPGALRILKLSLWCYAFIMLGYFMYFTTLIRSNGNPSIDMGNVENPMNLVYYLSREQYGHAPLLYGPHFLADVKRGENGRAETEELEMRYAKGKDKYIPLGRKREYVYESKDKLLFPRIWDSSNDQNHFDSYIDWLEIPTKTADDYSIVSGIDYNSRIVQLQNQAGQTTNVPIEDDYVIRVQRGQQLYPGEKIAVQVPSFAKHVEWFFSYQMGYMYWRYFMWNFAGKQNDIQGLNANPRDGNWVSGIDFIDNKRLGDQSALPDSIKNNKAHNKLYMLPFILGIIGCVYQFLKNKRDWIVTFLLFFLTGIGVVIYLNQPGSQPRERDYAYVGSFYAFAIWIGLSVVGFVRLAREKADKVSFTNTLIYGSVLTFVIIAMSCVSERFGGTLFASIVTAALYAAVTAIIVLIVRAASSSGTNGKVANIVAAVIAILIPVLMAQQIWDDHDRSKKTLGPDLAKDYLESCAPNAIIFTFGDNDTYPLWYAQEVEGVRPDIRIINTSLLGIDWYINQLRYKTNNADSVDVIWTPEQIEQGSREQIVIYPDEKFDKEFYPLIDVMKGVLGRPKLDPTTQRDVGDQVMPLNKVMLPVDSALVRSNGTVNADDKVLPSLQFQIPKDYLFKNDLIMLNILATNNWKRPIYFTAPYGELGFGEYLRKDGLSYRLVPAVMENPAGKWEVNNLLRASRLGGTNIRANNLDTAYKNMLEKFEFGGADKKGVYFDEENRRHLLNIRSLFGEIAGNLGDAGKKEMASKLLDKAEKGIDTLNFPYALVSRYNNHNQTSLLYMEGAYKAGRKDIADRVKNALRKDFEQQRAYFRALNDGLEPNRSFEGNTKLMQNMFTEWQVNEAMIRILDAIEQKYDPKSTSVPNPPPGKETPGTILPGDSARRADSVPKRDS
jgi:hypothetical protein